MCEIEPQRDIAQKMRLLCCAVNIITESKKMTKSGKSKQSAKVSEKSKKIKKKKVSRDEKKILKLQKADKGGKSRGKKK